MKQAGSDFVAQNTDSKRASGKMERKTGRPRSFDELKSLNRAMLVFWEFGYEATSIAVLSKAMGLNPPSIYSSYGDKKALFLKALDLYVGDLDIIQTQLNAQPSAYEAVKAMLYASARRFTGAGTPRGCLLASATVSCSPAARDLQKAASSKRAAIEKLICARIEKDIAASVLSPLNSPKALATVTIAVIQGMSVLARDGASRKKLLILADSALKAWR